MEQKREARYFWPDTYDQLTFDKGGKNIKWGSSLCGSVEINLTSTQEDLASIPGLTQWVKDLVLW